MRRTVEDTGLELVAQRLKAAHDECFNQGEISESTGGDAVPELIRSSWQRCMQDGLAVSEKRDYDPLRRNQLSALREQHRQLLSYADPVMASLREQLAHTQSTVILADAHGLILQSFGDPEFLAKAARVALKPGVTWSENSKGTNAIGTALIERRPVVVHGAQHYCTANHFLTCSAAPIFGPDGDPLGVLDVTGDHRSYQAHTLALAKLSAQMIENNLAANVTPRDGVHVHFHYRHEYLGTLQEGIIVFSDAGICTGANRAAASLIGTSVQRLVGVAFEALFDARFESVLAQRGEVVALSASKTTSAFFARVRHALARPGHHALLREHASRGEPLARSSTRAASNLQALATGDARVGAAIAKVERVLGRDIAILIHGETGTGKELLAQAIHRDSPRRDGAFIAVNCAAIPESLIESELFGYEEGAFTGARRKGHRGLIAQADGGTLFLDEIGDMPLALQARLLRTLQERSVAALGGGKPVAVDIAVVSASNKNLREQIKAGAFREDLYYRLNGLLVELPALRERSDLAVLAHALIAREANSDPQISAAAMKLFERHPWPGNIRQLHNVLRAGIALAGDARAIEIEHLPSDFLGEAGETHNANEASACLQDVELRTIQAALEAHGGNVSAAARQLGINRVTIYRKLKRR
jgi:sigma-54 dependent transcriptional regulator, acetoin dehydrogenase operon transcriptional activator AcoR